MRCYIWYQSFVFKMIFGVCGEWAHRVTLAWQFDCVFFYCFWLWNRNLSCVIWPAVKCGVLRPWVTGGRETLLELMISLRPSIAWWTRCSLLQLNLEPWWHLFALWWWRTLWGISPQNSLVNLPLMRQTHGWESARRSTRW